MTTRNGAARLSTEQQVRRAFWDEHTQYQRDGNRPQNRYPADVRAAWVAYVDMLARDGTITEALAQRVTL